MLVLDPTMTVDDLAQVGVVRGDGAALHEPPRVDRVKEVDELTGRQGGREMLDDMVPCRPSHAYAAFRLVDEIG
ncbi:MAG: hypothetical protein KDB69_10620, partial [Acidimicrobiia bacterium]|nr:hypothetical protein [Acidimicrobiia bacterium]